jgi:putative SOS response-associated peptidase YedK
MCGRYILRQTTKAIREWEKYGPPAFLDSFNVAPTQQVPVLRLHGADPQFIHMRWGLVPFFARGEPPKYSTINARVETFETAATYRGPWRRAQRCLQLASGFYEWHLDEQGRKAPYLITLADQELFAFAALWDRSVTDGGRALESCVHITMPANALMADIHNSGNHPHRMPAIVAAADRETWLSGSMAQARSVLRQYPADLMDAYEVSTRLNSVKNDDPGLINPVRTRAVA